MAQKERYTIGEVTIVGQSDGNVTVQMRDAAGNAIMCRGSALPAAGSSGYAVGCLFNITGAGGGLFVNSGSTTSGSFQPAGAVTGTNAEYKCIAAKSTTTAGGDTTETVTIAGAQTTDFVMGGYSVTDDTDIIAEMTITAEDTITYVASADPSTAHAAETMVFRKGGVAAWDIFAAGTVTTTGGDATETETVTGALATDKCIVTITDGGTNDETLASAKMTANTLTTKYSGDPGADCVYNYVVFRPAGSFVSAYKIPYMGSHTTVGGDTTEVITATGVVATDKIILIHATSDDTDYVKTITPTANTITTVASADPSTAHSYTWMAIRAK